jgi:hypothetical protein
MQGERNEMLSVGGLEFRRCLSSFENFYLPGFEQATVFNPTVAMACA